MKKTLLLRFGIACILALWAGGAAANPAMWRASDEDSEIWLFGSIHLLQENTQWKTPRLDHALESADLFYYEAPMDKEAQAEIAALVSQHGVNPDGRKLTDYLTGKETALLTRVAKDLDLPLTRLQPLKPWLASVTLQIVFAQQAGYSPGAGVEMMMEPLTPDGQERFFETASEQIGFFSELSQEAAVGALVAASNQIEEQPSLLDEMVAAWEAGDVEIMSSLFHGAMKDAGPDAYEALVTDRNKAWSDEILTMMEGDEDILVVVGAGHTVGKSSVPTLLEAEGVAVERIQ